MALFGISLQRLAFAIHELMDSLKNLFTAKQWNLSFSESSLGTPATSFSQFPSRILIVFMLTF
jgi:hypothetical protein